MNNKASLDSPTTVYKHREIIDKKKILKSIYISFYKELIKFVKLSKKDKVVELGSGGGFFKKLYPKAITSDIVKAPGVDMKFKAENMPFKNSEVSFFYGLNVLHHIKDVAKAFEEIERCLKNEGKAIFVEPANTPFSYFIYRFIHHENFDKTAGWKINSGGRLSGANAALPWIIFVRDKKIFQEKYKKLKVVNISLHTPFSYLLSGGLSKPQFLPTSWILYITKIEQALGFLNNYFAMFMTVIIKKN